MIVGLIGELERAGGDGFQRADQVRVAALRAVGVRLSPAERVLEDLAVFGVVGAEPGPAHDTQPTVVATLPERSLTSSDVSTGVREGHPAGSAPWRHQGTPNEAHRPAQDAGRIGIQVEEA